LLSLAAAASCAAPDTSDIRYVRHIGDVGRGCDDLSAGQASLFIEDRPVVGVVAISNRSASPINFYYDTASSFGDYQMFSIRFRDASGNVIRLNGGGECGWWSPKALESNL
jgi:hypothetical protein